MLKILYVFGAEKASGAEIVVERLIKFNDACQSHLILAPGSFANQLQSDTRKYEVLVFDRLKKLNRNRINPLQFYFKAIYNYFAVSFFVYKYVKQHKIDIIHANTIVPASYILPLICYYKIVKSKVKSVWSDHDLKYYSKMDGLMSRLCCKCFNVTLVVSEAVKLKYEGVKKVKVLYNGLDTCEYKPDNQIRQNIRLRLGITDSTIVIGIPAIIAPRKGQLNLIKAFNGINTSKSVKLLIAGDFAPDYYEYGIQVKKLIFNNSCIEYIGKVADMVSFYNACDIIVNNSSSEGSEPLGTTIYEAMACEKVVIASNTGGTSEIVTDKVDGFIFEADNIDKLERMLMIVISDNDFYEIKKAARLKVIQKFNIKVMTEKYNCILSNYE